MLTNAQLAKYRKRLLETSKDLPVYDEKGRPCYTLLIYGTPEEIAETRRKLLELDYE